MRKKLVALSIVVGFALVMVTCNASTQKGGATYGGEPTQTAGGKGRLQSMVVELNKSKDPKAGLLAKKIKAIAMELKRDGKDLRPLQPHLNRMENAARAGDFEAADRALMDAVGEAYNADFWKEVSFKSVDGFRVYSYLSRPKNKKKYPIIVLVHGGEHGSATSYQRHALRFLKAGFATLAVDYRGSSGHGDSYKDAGDLAGKEIDDVVKAVEYVYNDPSSTSVGLMGSSHGAYIGGNVLPRTPHVTAANLNFGGYNFETLMKGWKASSEPVAQTKIDTWSPIIGEPGSPEYEQAATLSPINNTGKIHAPLLLIHGKRDASVPYRESINFYEELKKDRKRVSLKLFEDGSHGFIFRNTEEAEEAYRITEDFFKKNLK